MYQISDSLDKNWSREIILTKIKDGENSDKIVNEFFKENKEDIKKIADLINIDNYGVLDNLISLSECELKLIKRIKDIEMNKVNSLRSNNSTLNSKKDFRNDISLFMNRWSNKFVIIALITMSLISLTKQAWI